MAKLKFSKAWDHIDPNCSEKLRHFEDWVATPQHFEDWVATPQHFILPHQTIRKHF